MTPDLRRDLTNDLIRDEGIRYESYQDTVGLWTVGVGHLLGNDRRVGRITHSEALSWFRDDLDAAAALAQSLFPEWDKLTHNRQRALINMAFNLGSRLGQFVNFRTSIGLGDWLKAGEQMEQSKWWKQVGVRAVRLRYLIEKG